MSTKPPRKRTPAQRPMAVITPGIAADVAVRLSLWFTKNCRDLPWRATEPDPYAVMVSEAMLQQTQVSTVVPYFQRWMHSFPTVSDLAGAPEEGVLAVWSGLGYYRRARSLRNAAQIIEQRYGGLVPADPDALRGLPGIGRYTAGAILSIAYNQPAAAVDGNVIRVLSRLLAVRVPATGSAAVQALEPVASALAMAGTPRVVSQALMEVGALVCRPAPPQCPDCPLEGICLARAEGSQTSYPVTPVRRPAEPVEMVALLIEHNGRLLVTDEPVAGFWRGLWHLPTSVVGDGQTPDDVAQALQTRLLPGGGGQPTAFGKVRHAVTYRRITLHAFSAPCSDLLSATSGKWIALDDIGSLPHPAPHGKLIQECSSARGTGILKCQCEERR